MSSGTRVISVRGRKHLALQADPNFVYVGRKCYGWPDSIWGNPFKVGMGWREIEAISPAAAGLAQLVGSAHILGLYRAWVMERDELVLRLPELEGKTLGCWCGDWMPGRPEIGCHAVVLAKLADTVC